ncbi:MAG TPA: DNA polymerase III subunit [Polyangiaceae bacterium]|nr:DNA polymerase III subunit [Polyangiaceae bacterium]
MIGPHPWLPTLRGQPTALAILRRGLASSRLHHALLFDGPDGVGKTLAAFGLAQALVCDRRAAGVADACGQCTACLRSVPRGDAKTTLHPDVTVIERGLYDAAVINRRTPETQEISIDQIRTLVLTRAAFPPHEGHAKVFVVQRAEELSMAAANALLKTLEEPGPRTHFVLLSSAAESLLPTIRSRTLRIRFGALPDAVVADLLVERGVDRTQAIAVAALSVGSMSTALALGDSERAALREQFVARAISALEARDSGGVFDLAEDSKKVAKDEVIVQLRALAAALATSGRSSAGDPDARADVATARFVLALAAIDQIEANASVQLAVESMLLRMRSA